MEPCKIIAFEGADRVGKATQSKRLTEVLSGQGFLATRIETPIRDKHTYRLIYWMLKNGWAKKLPVFFQSVQVMNRLIFQLTDLRLHMRTNDYLIFDRWALSTWVYGKATGVGDSMLKFLCSPVNEPDFTIILDGDPHVKEVRDTYEADRDLQNRVRGLYRDAASRKRCCTAVIDANQTQDEVASCIRRELEFQGLIQERRSR